MTSTDDKSCRGRGCGQPECTDAVVWVPRGSRWNFDGDWVHQRIVDVIAQDMADGRDDPTYGGW